MTFTCPGCKTELKAPTLKPGDVCDCPQCGKQIEVPFKQIKVPSKMVSQGPDPAPAAPSQPDRSADILQCLREQTALLKAIKNIMLLVLFVVFVLPFLLGVFFGGLGNLF